MGNCRHAPLTELTRARPWEAYGTGMWLDGLTSRSHHGHDLPHAIILTAVAAPDLAAALCVDLEMHLPGRSRRDASRTDRYHLRERLESECLGTIEWNGRSALTSTGEVALELAYGCDEDTRAQGCKATTILDRFGWYLLNPSGNG